MPTSTTTVTTESLMAALYAHIATMGDLIDSCDHIEAREDDIAAMARTAQVDANRSRVLASDIAEHAAITAGHLRRAKDQAERAVRTVRRLADAATETQGANR
jgi:hypothetical protein